MIYFISLVLSDNSPLITKFIMHILLIAVIISISCITEQVDPDRFNSKYVDDVLSNKRLTNAYIKCVLDEGACTAEGRELKSHITTALQTDCTKCTDAHRKAIYKVIKYLIEYKNRQWKQLINKYDPKRKYTVKYEKDLKNLLAD